LVCGCLWEPLLGTFSEGLAEGLWLWRLSEFLTRSWAELGAVVGGTEGFCVGRSAWIEWLAAGILGLLWTLVCSDYPATEREATWDFWSGSLDLGRPGYEETKK